jgi:hypothetical protein
VLFDTRENCRTENLEFEVVDLESCHHALLGRPALSKFMASSNISYLKMKMTGPNGVIAIAGDYRRSMECASAGSNLAESLVIAREKRRIQEVTTLAQSAQLNMPALANPHRSVSFQSTKDTKKIQIDDQFPERIVTIGVGLNAK